MYILKYWSTGKNLKFIIRYSEYEYESKFSKLMNLLPRFFTDIVYREIVRTALDENASNIIVVPQIGVDVFCFFIVLVGSN